MTAIVVGYTSAIAFRLDGITLPVDATFTAMARASVRGTPTGMTGAVLATLTTANGGVLQTEDAGSPVLTLVFSAAATAAWTTREVVVDVVRTDVAPSAYLGFKALISVHQPVTVIAP